MRVKRVLVSLLLYLNGALLGVTIAAHILSFWGIGILSALMWVGIGLLAGMGLFMISSIHQTDRLFQHYYGERRKPFSLKYMFESRSGTDAFYRYAATSHITMPLSPKWLVAIVRPTFLLFIPYTFLQIYLLFLFRVGSEAVFARLIAPWIFPLMIYSLPILLSWKREMTEAARRKTSQVG